MMVDNCRIVTRGIVCESRGSVNHLRPFTVALAQTQLNCKRWQIQFMLRMCEITKERWEVARKT